MRVSLYRRKAQKLRLTTVIFLFLILLLPVVSFKFSFDLYVKYSFENLKNEYSDALSFNRLNLVNLEDSINLVNTKTKSLKLKLGKYIKEIKQVEDEIEKKSNLSKFVRAFDDFWMNQSRSERLFLKELNVSSGRFAVSYFEITNLPLPISRQVFQNFVKRAGLLADFSKSEISPRQYGKYRTFLNLAEVSAPKGAER